MILCFLAKYTFSDSLSVNFIPPTPLDVHPLHNLPLVGAHPYLTSPMAASFGIMAPTTFTSLRPQLYDTQQLPQTPSVSSSTNMSNISPGVWSHRSHSRHSSVSSMSAFAPSEIDAAEARWSSPSAEPRAICAMESQDAACLDRAAFLSLCPGEGASPAPPSTSAATLETLKTPARNRSRHPPSLPSNSPSSDDDDEDDEASEDEYKPTRTPPSKKTSLSRQRSIDEDDVIFVTAITSSGKKSHAKKVRPRSAPTFLRYPNCLCRDPLDTFLDHATRLFSTASTSWTLG